MGLHKKLKDSVKNWVGLRQGGGGMTCHASASHRRGRKCGSRQHKVPALPTNTRKPLRARNFTKRVQRISASAAANYFGLELTHTLSLSVSPFLSLRLVLSRSLSRTHGCTHPFLACAVA